MEKEFYTDEFEQLLKEKADQFRMYPSKRVWHSIYNNLHPGRRWPSVVMSLFLISSLTLIGYLNTGDNTINRQLSNTSFTQAKDEITNAANPDKKKQLSTSYTKAQQQDVTEYDNAFDDVITNETDFYTYTIVKSNRPGHFCTAPAPVADIKIITGTNPVENNKDIVQVLDSYIKSNKIFADIALGNKKNKSSSSQTTAKSTGVNKNTVDNTTEDLTPAITNSTAIEPVTVNSVKTDISKLKEVDKKTVSKINTVELKNTLTDEEKGWMENYAADYYNTSNKWRGKLKVQFYATPAVNYRKLSTKVKGSATAFANADINKAISQKPGFGFETGIGLNYNIAKRLLLKAGVQFNYTNYNIDADKTNHPIITTILLNDPGTGYSYAAARTSTISNAYNASALQPIKLHNRTYQISIPVGFAYKLSGVKNVDWFAGASVQPTYVFAGNAHLLSSDLKSYVSDPSSMSTLNLNWGFETYMNFKLGGYNLQVGPQVRYQVYSTYGKDVALIEKPYAVGLKFGLTKGF